MTSFANLLSKCRSLGKFAGEKMGLKRQRDLVNKAGLGCAAALLELLGHRIAPLNAIGFVAAGTETILALLILINTHGAADRVLHRGSSGWLLQAAEILTGPLSLLLRAFGLIPFAAISFLVDALLSRYGWLLAGKISGRDPEAVFASQR